jgi:DNA-binding MarR family transcriptional regulator
MILEQNDERSSLVNAILEKQKTVFQVMQGGVSPDWLEVDLTMPQLKIIFLLNAHTRMRMSELSRVLGKNMSTTTGVVEHLVEHGLVNRETEPDDRRVVIATISDKGRELCDSLLKVGTDETNEVLGSLNFDELKIVQKGMELYFNAALEHAKTKFQADCKVNK